MDDQDLPYRPPAIVEKRESREAVLYAEPHRHRGARDSEELTLDFSQVFKMWLRRWRSALALGVLAAIATVAIGLQAKKVYTATAMVVVESVRDIVHVNATPDGLPPDSSAVDTKVMLASSEALAARVVEREHLLNDPEFAGVRKPGAPPPSIAQVADAVRRHLTVRRAGLTWTLQLEFKSENAAKAAALANALADEFINWEVDSKVDSNGKTKQFINEHLTSLQREAEAAETQVQQYKIAHNLMSTAGQTIAETQVGTLSTQIASAQAELAEKQARLAAANEQNTHGGSNQDNSAALTSNTIGQLRTQQAEVSRRLAELKAHYGPKYPDVQKAEGQLADINANIQEEANRIHSSLQAEVSAAAQRLRSLRSSQEVAQGSLASNNRAEVGLVELERRAEASRQLYDAFLNRSKEASVQGSEQPDARVFDRATVPTSPTSPNKTIIILSALVVALAVAVLTVAGLEILDTSIRSSDDVVTKLGLPVVGIVPTPASSDKKFRATDKRLTPQDYLLKKPFSAFTESFRNIRATLILPDSFGRRNKVVAIASSLPKEGKSTTAFCLMRATAMSGTSVVLIDCDLRRRGTSAFVEGTDGKGLIEVLKGQIPYTEALVFDKESSGWVLPITGRMDEQTDLFTSPAMDALLETLKERFEVVLIDTPAALAVADARILATKADAVLFITRWATTPAKAVELGLESLSSVGANVIGVVLSRVDINRQARTSYGDRSGYYRSFAGYYQD